MCAQSWLWTEIKGDFLLCPQLQVLLDHLNLGSRAPFNPMTCLLVVILQKRMSIRLEFDHYIDDGVLPRIGNFDILT